MKFDADTGNVDRWDYAQGSAEVYGNEAPFAPRTGATAAGQEDDGYVVTFTTDRTDWRSECVVFDASDISAGPIVRLPLPRRVPAGFHANWVSGEQLWGIS